MKMLFSLTFAFMLLPVLAMGAPPAPVQGPAQAPTKSVLAPTQAPAQAPAKTTAMVPANTGYRTYSYQPTVSPMNSGYAYGYGYGPTTRASRLGAGFNSAGHKITGQW
jgi:hypothetical protein